MTVPPPASAPAPTPPVPTPPVPTRGGRPSQRAPGKFYPGSDANLLHRAFELSGAVARISRPLALGLAGIWVIGVTAWVSWLNGPLAGSLTAFALVLGSLLWDTAMLVRLPHRRVSFGPFAPQFLLLATLRGLAALALSGLARAGLGLTAAYLHLALQLAGCALVTWGFLVEPAHLGLTRQHARAAQWQRLSGAPLRVLQIGDLHLERPSVREAQLQRTMDALQPDLILFTGDFLNLSCVYDRTAWAAVRQVIQGWHARYGVYAVTGSPLVDPPDVAAQLLEGLPITWLRNQSVVVGPPEAPVRLIGLNCTHIPEDDQATLEAVLATAPGRDLYTVLLYHSPDLAPAAAAAGLDLHLAGHTHGGQVRLPLFGAVITSSLYGKRFEMGLYRLGAMTLYVARGIGLEGLGAPRVRFLCPPEIVLWEIEAGT